MIDIDRIIVKINQKVHQKDFKKDELIKNLTKVYKYSTILNKQTEFWDSIARNNLNLYVYSLAFDFARIEAKHTKSMCADIMKIFINEMNTNSNEVIKEGINKLVSENHLNVFDISEIASKILIDNTDQKNILFEKLMEIELSDNIFAIHRTGGFDPSIICEEGLIITADTTQGVALDDKINEDLIEAISQNVTVFNHNIGTELTSIFNGGLYKNIPGKNGNVMFIEIPKNLEHSKNVLETKNSSYYLPKEYISGYVTLSPDCELIVFVDSTVSIKNKNL